LAIHTPNKFFFSEYGNYFKFLNSLVAGMENISNFSQKLEKSSEMIFRQHIFGHALGNLSPSERRFRFGTV
jgi:hypothetical protein